jgi:hypothetical protein
MVDLLRCGPETFVGFAIDDKVASGPAALKLSAGLLRLGGVDSNGATAPT